MKHLVKKFFCFLLVLATLAGCSHATSAVSADDLAGKSYVYEKDGFGGPFTISLEKDGSFTYYEGMLSSYIGMGEWTVEENILTLREKDRRFSFRVDGEELVFRNDESGNFLYVDVLDGEKFTAKG